jgi:cytochrome c peroxidase
VIDDVPGLNGRMEDPVRRPIQNGTCSICHDTPNAGNHSVAMALNIGIADPSRRTPDLPLYTLRNLATRELVRTTDPGRAMVTGKWADIGKFKGPILRGLAARPPYFHDGSAATIADVIAFYDQRFHIHLTDREKADLIAFLGAL